LIRAAFLGTPAAAVPALAVLLDVATVEFVVTQPDRPAGRGRRSVAPPVKTAAIEWGIPVLQPRDDDGLLDAFIGRDLDVAVVVAYGRILSPRLLASVKKGFLNVHFSLLPRWRGAAPVARAILAGDDYTGISLMVLDAGMDTGPVLAVAETPIADHENAGQLTGRLAAQGAELLAEYLDDYVHDQIRPAAQMATGATRAPRVTVREAHLDVEATPTDFARAVRAYNPRPGGWLRGEGQRIKVFEVGPAGSGPDPGEIRIINGAPILGLGRGAVELVRLQPAGKGVVSGRAWANGRRGKGLRVEEAPE
jgi:methionyl-tRNA formyltransferase